MITGRVRGQEFKLTSPLIVADSIDYLTALFTFHTADWAGLDICSHWRNGAVVYDIWLENGQITKDKHLNLSAGTWTVWLHGNENVNGEVVQRITTEEATLIVKGTGALDGEPFPEVPASELERLYALLLELTKAKLSPIDKTSGMTQPVGRDSDGKLWTAPSGGTGSGGGGSISVEYDDTTGELTIASTPEDAVRFDPETGDLTIGG